MADWQRRVFQYAALIAAVMLGYAIVYYVGMHVFENEPISFLHGLQVVVETFTTTGYGSDAPWRHPAMNLLMIAMPLTGVALIFLALPVLVVPLIEEAFSTTVPTHVEDASDHVVICTYSSRAETLVGELESRDVAYVFVEPDRERATDLYEKDYEVIHADPDSVDGLEAAGLSRANALVVDVSDTVDASIVLTAREVAEDVRVVSVVEDPDRARYHDLAGADAVLSPRSLLGRALARKITTALSADLGEAVELGEDFDVIELPVHRESDLVGTTLAESGIRERAGVNVIGAWFDGEFRSAPPPESTIEPGTVLLVTGGQDQVERFKESTLSGVRRFERGEVVVAGYGEVGQTVVETLADADVSYTVLDQRDHPAVDVVGDATDPETYEQADLDDARSVVFALPDDTTTEFATLVVRDESDAVEVIARAEEREAIGKIYRAGADYVLSLSKVTGRMTASEVLEEEVVSPDTQVEILETEASGLVGQSLGDARVRTRTECTVVAVERNGEVFTDVGPDFTIHAGDELVVAGTDEGTNRFTELFE